MSEEIWGNCEKNEQGNHYYGDIQALEARRM